MEKRGKISGIPAQYAGGGLSFQVSAETNVYYFSPAGTGMVTFPVAAHSVPRVNVPMNPALFMASVSWPNAVAKTRPLP